MVSNCHEYTKTLWPERACLTNCTVFSKQAGNMCSFFQDHNKFARAMTVAYEESYNHFRNMF